MCMYVTCIISITGWLSVYLTPALRAGLKFAEEDELTDRTKGISAVCDPVCGLLPRCWDDVCKLMPRRRHQSCRGGSRQSLLSVISVPSKCVTSVIFTDSGFFNFLLDDRKCNLDPYKTTFPWLCFCFTDNS